MSETFAERSTLAWERPRRVVVLGSTGSIGTNTLDVLAALADRLIVFGLCAHSSGSVLLEQARRFRPRFVVLTDRTAYEAARREALPEGTQWLFGEAGVRELVTAPEVDIVVSAIVGAAGLRGTWAALEAGKTVALANKETLVAAGPLVMALARQKQATLLPVDSEHSAIFQALAGHPIAAVERVVLTGSGGPFRGKNREQLARVSVEEALRHPTWKMGPKITVDSATLMNKALEVIEARWLFDLPVDRIDVQIHPQSIVHSFVEFRDGSVMAQLSPPDMRLPIQYALTYPERVPGPSRKLDWASLRKLEFEAPDRTTFPALDLGFEVARQAGVSGAVLNAANEVAVERFLAGELDFLDIPEVCRDTLIRHPRVAEPNLDAILDADAWARQEVIRWTRHR